MHDIARASVRNLWCVAFMVGCASPHHHDPDAGSIEAVSCVGWAANPGLGAYNSTLIAQVQAASYIFRATVTSVAASSVVVHVDADTYMDADTQMLGDTWGTTVTIDTTGLAVGDRAVFLTQIAMWNGALEVRELARVDPVQSPSFEADVPRMMQLFAANPLYARIASSIEIVIGDVGAITPHVNTGAESEHDPGWELASVSADHIACGPNVDATTVAAGFPGSIDIAWYRAPKLTSGQQAVLLLHHEVAPIDSSIVAPDAFVIDPLDVHPLADAAAIEQLLASPPPLP